jgi:hypothetical protein
MNGLPRFWKRWSPLLITVVAAIWTALTAIASSYWSVRQFQASSEEFQTRLAFDREVQDKTRRIESQKPFLEKRLEIYLEVIKVSSRLTEWDLPIDSAAWKDNAKRFWQMRWGELEMVGDPGIRNAARLVGEQITRAAANPLEDRHPLRWAVECLADELRYSIEHTWGLERGLTRQTVLKDFVSKVPDGCNQDRVPPVRPPGMP